MNFVYLIVPGCNNCLYEGLDLLNNSIMSLKKYNIVNKIYIYYGFDESSKSKIKDIEKFISDKDLIGINFGYLKHNFPRIERDGVANSIKNPYRLNILIEKIYILLNHDETEEIFFIDLDTHIKEKIPKFDLSKPVLYMDEGLLLKKRGLGSFFNNMEYEVDENFKMFNTGFIYLPLKNRKKIAKEAIELVLEMNRFEDKYRVAKDLDEQIALSVIIFKYYKNNINFTRPYIEHFFGRHIIRKV